MNALRNIMKILALICLVNLCLINAQEAATEGLSDQIVENNQEITEDQVQEEASTEGGNLRFMATACARSGIYCSTNSRCCSKICMNMRTCV